MAHRVPASIPAARVVADTPADAIPAAGSRVRPAPASDRFRSVIVRTPVAIGLAVLALALVVGGVGAFVFLPTATAVISPKASAIEADRSAHRRRPERDGGRPRGARRAGGHQGGAR